MILNERELNIVEAVINDLRMHFTESELNTFIGSETIKEMATLANKLHYREYCEEHGIKYEDMTEDDFMQAYEEEWEA